MIPRERELYLSINWWLLTSAFRFVSNGISGPKSLERSGGSSRGVAQAFKDRVIKEGPWEEGGDADNMRMKMATCIRKVASEEFGVSRGVEAKLKMPGGVAMMSRRLLRRRKIVSDSFTRVGVQTTWRSTRWHRRPQNEL